ncbi:unnamed protein product, partial [Polarella glacialis]
MVMASRSCWELVMLRLLLGAFLILAFAEANTTTTAAATTTTTPTPTTILTTTTTTTTTANTTTTTTTTPTTTTITAKAAPPAPSDSNTANSTTITTNNNNNNNKNNTTTTTSTGSRAPAGSNSSNNNNNSNNNTNNNNTNNNTNNDNTNNTNNKNNSEAPAGSPDPDLVLQGEFQLTVPDCEAFIAEDGAKDAVASGLANATGLAFYHVEVDISCASRRLAARKTRTPTSRRLADLVTANYTITIPSGDAAAANSIGSVLATVIKPGFKDVLTGAIQAAMDSSGIAVTISVTRISGLLNGGASVKPPPGQGPKQLQMVVTLAGTLGLTGYRQAEALDALRG